MYVCMYVWKEQCPPESSEDLSALLIHGGSASYHGRKAHEQHACIWVKVNMQQHVRDIPIGCLQKQEVDLKGDVPEDSYHKIR